MIRISIIRVLSLVSLFTVGLFSLFAIPMDDSPTWALDLILSKGVAFIMFWLFHRLYERWKVGDRLIRAFDMWSNKGIDNPNPMHTGRVKVRKA